MAIFCALCLSPNNNCKLLLLKQVWVLLWPTGARSIFSSTFSLTGFLACNRASLSVYVQHCKPDCAAFCLFLFLHSQMHLTSTSWVSFCQPFSVASARGKALVWARSSAKLCMLDGQHHTLSGAREGPSLYPNLVNLWWENRNKIAFHSASPCLGEWKWSNLKKKGFIFIW